MARFWVMLIAFAFIAGFVMLTIATFAAEGVTRPWHPLRLILFVLLSGVVGALRHPRK